MLLNKKDKENLIICYERKVIMVLLILCYKGTNLGMMLQAFATVKYLEEIGVRTNVLEFIPPAHSSTLFQKMFLALKPGVIKYKLIKTKRKLMIANHPEISQAQDIRIKGNQEFTNKYLGKIVKYSDLDRLKKDSFLYDAILVGSDQQWFPSALNSDISTLMFVADDVRKISYATSFGVSSLPNSVKKRAVEYLSRIDYLSVREASGAKIVKDLIDKEPFIAVDPTLLFDSNKWDSLFNHPEYEKIEENYILTYFLGGNIRHRISVWKFAKEKGLKVIAVRNLESNCKNEAKYVDRYINVSSPEEFIFYLKNSECVCTDSFHGTVFSLIYHIPFFTYLRYSENDSNSRNSRIKDLLLSIGESERLITDNNKIEHIANNKIDFEKIDNIIKNQRERSSNFLCEAILKGLK